MSSREGGCLGILDADIQDDFIWGNAGCESDWKKPFIGIMLGTKWAYLSESSNFSRFLSFLLILILKFESNIFLKSWDFL